MIFSTFSTRSHLAKSPLTILAVGTALALSLALAAPVAAHPPADKPAAAKDHDDGAMKGMAGMKGMEGMKGMSGMKGMGGHDDGGHEHGAPTFSFGHPSPDATPDQVVKIDALDSMSYNPSSVSVKAGSVVKFVVTNTGEIAHAWAIDTVEEQLEHEAGMGDVDMDKMMTHMDGEPNGFVLKPGETKTLVWTFTKGGDIQYACHLPGHYDAGMHGELDITGGKAMSTADHDDDDDHGKAKAHGH